MIVHLLCGENKKQYNNNYFNPTLMHAFISRFFNSENSIEISGYTEKWLRIRFHYLIFNQECTSNIAKINSQTNYLFDQVNIE